MADMDRDFARSHKSAHNQNLTDYCFQSAAGGVFGSGPLPWTIDRLTVGHTDRFSELWRQHVSPRSSEHDSAHLDYRIAKQKFDQSGEDLKTTIEQIKPFREQMHRDRFRLDAIIARTQSEYMSADGSEKLRLLHKKLKVLDDARQSYGSIDPAKLQTRKLPDGNFAPTDGKFLTADELDFLTEQHALYGRRLDLINKHRLIRQAQELAASQLGDAAARIEQLQANRSAFDFFGTTKGPWCNLQPEHATGAERMVREWRSDRFSNKIGEGVAVGAAYLAADYCADKLLGYQGTTLKSPSYYLEFPLVSGILLSDRLTAKGKTIATAVSIFAGKCLEEHLPLPNGTYRAVMTPNWIDSFGMAAAWSLPWHSARGRLMGVAGAYGLGRIADIMHNVLHLPFPGLARDDEESQSLYELSEASPDKVPERSTEKFSQLVEHATRLGLSDANALKSSLRDFWVQHEADSDKPEILSRGAALSTAMGNTLLARGTDLSGGNIDASEQLLADENYDLGGKALVFFKYARTRLTEADRKSRSDALSNEMKVQLKEACQSIDSRLETVYGAHNIERIYRTLKDGYQRNSVQFETFASELRSETVRIDTTDSKYAAKMCRDVALLELVMAGSKGADAAEAVRADAIKFLTAAEQLDRSAPDLAQLGNIAAQQNFSFAKLESHTELSHSLVPPTENRTNYWKSSSMKSLVQSTQENPFCQQLLLPRHDNQNIEN